MNATAEIKATGPKTITLQIELARSIALARSDIAPTKVMLGTAQIAMLEELCRDSGWIGPQMKLEILDGDRRLEFRGLKVYRADEEQYCEALP